MKEERAGLARFDLGAQQVLAEPAFVTVQALGARAGVALCNPHALRRGTGYALAMRGVDTRRLQVSWATAASRAP